MVSTNFYESLNELVTDSRFRNLSVSQNFENFFNEYGINEGENIHTFSWLLAPKGSHGLKDIFLKELLTTAWTMIHGQYDGSLKKFKGISFYNHISPLFIQKASFMGAFVDRDITKDVLGADLVISDIESNLLVVINNRYDKAQCEKVYATFTSDIYAAFENKLFISLDSEAQTIVDSHWMYMNNEWLINLCSTVIEGRQYNDNRVIGYLKDFYQFLTGTQYGLPQNSMAEYSSTLISNFYQTFVDFKNFKAEKINDRALIDINPREYASIYKGRISEKEYEVLSLYWSHRNTFNTFFQLTELEGVTRDMDKMVENKSYRFDRTFIRNGLRFTPSFDKVKADRSFMNTIFDVELVQDWNKNLMMSMVINKKSWDRLTHVQREVIQKNFDFAGGLLKDRVVVWNKFHKQDWKNKDLSNEIISLFEKVDHYLGNLGIRAA